MGQSTQRTKAEKDAQKQAEPPRESAKAPEHREYRGRSAESSASQAQLAGETGLKIEVSPRQVSIHFQMQLSDGSEPSRPMAQDIEKRPQSMELQRKAVDLVSGTADNFGRHHKIDKSSFSFSAKQKLKQVLLIAKNMRAFAHMQRELSRRLRERELGGLLSIKQVPAVGKRGFGCGCGGSASQQKQKDLNVFPELIFENNRLILHKQAVIDDWIRRIIEQAKQEYDA